MDLVVKAIQCKLKQVINLKLILPFTCNGPVSSIEILGEHKNKYKHHKTDYFC